MSGEKEGRTKGKEHRNREKRVNEEGGGGRREGSIEEGEKEKAMRKEWRNCGEKREEEGSGISKRREKYRREREEEIEEQRKEQEAYWMGVL